MDKNALKQYEKWCVENNKDPLTEESIKEYKDFLCEESQKRLDEVLSNIRADKMKKQKAIFKLMCDYVHSQVDYDENMFDGFEDLIASVVGAAITVASARKLSDELKPIFEKNEEEA